MKMIPLDIELHAGLEVSEHTILTQGMNNAIKEALEKFEVQLRGCIYVPDSMDNVEVFDEYSYPSYEEYFYNDKDIICKRMKSNSDAKHLLETIED